MVSLKPGRLMYPNSAAVQNEGLYLSLKILVRGPKSQATDWLFYQGGKIKGSTHSSRRCHKRLEPKDVVTLTSGLEITLSYVEVGLVVSYSG